ncbi:MAG: intein-containing replicative DNA helicase, partial [Actinomycetota bacterium]|nr:intein-containing replicative DNA helicase [Actinomycetota bacterium]
LEMSRYEIGMRLLCGEARVPWDRIRNKRVGPDDWVRVVQAGETLHEAPLHIVDAGNVNIVDIRAKARRMKTGRQGLSMIIVDYLQLMTSPNARRPDNRQQEVAEISRSLKLLAKELSIPVIALSQLNRNPEARADKRPQLSDLRECVTGDTLVHLADGSRVPIEELVGSSPSVLSMTPAGRIAESRADKVWRVGERPVFEVRTSSGRSIHATGDHRLCGDDGWIKVRELGVGSRLAISHRLPEPASGSEWADDRVGLLGQLIGDGSYLTSQPMRYSTASEDNSDLLRSVGAFGPRVAPAEALTMALDGVVANTNVDTLPARVFDQIRARMSDNGVTTREMATLRGTSYGGTSHFRFSPSRDLVAHYATLLHDEALLDQAGNDLFWDRVVDIRPAGVEDVYDLTVPGPSSWLAGPGIVSHNSGAIEQDSDLVVFIHRDDLDPEKKREAELILAKHRNGPTGQVRLHFEPSLTMFRNAARDQGV